MATIVIHAGMHKTGSTSIQRWIADNHERLRDQHDIQVLVAANRTRRNPTDEVRFEPYESGDVNSSRWIRGLVDAQQPAAVRRLVADLSTFANHSANLLISAELLSRMFWQLDDAFLRSLEELARDHEVRVAYYVRPQHGAIESLWRDSGFKHLELQASEWVRKQTRQLRYLRVLDSLQELAPSVGLGVRPFVPELLDGGNPVEDFVRRFLLLEERCDDVRANPGLPLSLVNVLRHAPTGWFWTWSEDRPIDTPWRGRVGTLLDGSEIQESARIRRSRAILQSYCHDVFESENQELIRRLGWPLEHFVPPTELDVGWSLGELDDLWTPEASEAERALLYQVLRAALA